MMSKIYVDFGTDVDDLRNALLRDGLIADSREFVPNHALKIGFINLMPKPKDPVHDFGLLFARHAEHDIEILNFSPTPEAIRTCPIAIAERNKLLPLADIDDYSLDALLLTGYGVEDVDFEELRFWPEVMHALDFAKTHEIPALASCWGSHAALYHYHGVPKTCDMNNKISGVFEQHIVMPEHALMQGIDATMMMPVSRFGRSDEQTIRINKALKILAESQETGSSIITDGQTLYLTGHPEYNGFSLPLEYKRDRINGTPHLRVPENVFTNNNIDQNPYPETWSKNAGLLVRNWTNTVAAAKVNKEREASVASSPHTAFGFV